MDQNLRYKTRKEKDPRENYTGLINGCEYGKDSIIDGKLSFYTVKRIKPSGLYGEEIEFALFRGEADPPSGTVVFSFPVNGETYSIVIP